MVIKAVATEVPFYVLSDSANGGVNGPFKFIWETLCQQLNMSVKVDFIGELAMGQVTSSTNGTGIMGSLMRNETQFSVIPQYLDQLGVQYLDYTAVIGEEDWIILSGPPRIFYVDHFSTLKSFEKSLWIAVICALFLYSLVRSLLFTIKLNEALKKKTFKQEFQNSLFDSYKSLINQDINVRRSHFYERLCLMCWLIASLNLSWSFTGNMLAKLAAKADPFRYDKLEDFLTHPEMQLGVLENTPPFDEIRDSKHPTMVALWKKLMDDGTAKEIEKFDPIQGIVDLTSGEFALIMLRRAILATSSFMCGTFYNLYISKEPVTMTMFSLYMRKDLPENLKNIIKKTVLATIESKTLDSRINMLVAVGELCMVHSHEEKTMPLTIDKFYFIFIFYGVATVIEIFCLIFEMATFRNHPKSTRRHWRRHALLQF